MSIISMSIKSIAIVFLDTNFVYTKIYENIVDKKIFLSNLEFFFILKVEKIKKLKMLQIRSVI